MSAPTAPFRGDWLSRLGGPLTVLSRVTMDGQVLDVISGTVTYDEESTPHVQASLQVRIPENVAALDAFDPRLNKRLRITTGYRVPGDVEEQLLCDLILTDRIVRRPGDVMELRAASDEQRILDTRPLGGVKTFTSASDGGWAIRDLLTWDQVSWAALGGAPPVEVSAFGGFVPDGDTVVINREDDLWNAIQDVADRIGAWVYHDGMGPTSGAFHVRRQPLNAGSAAAAFTVGPTGTITSSESQLGREDFANAVVVIYEWYQAGQQQSASGYAEITSGPYAVSTVGRKTKTVTIRRKGSASMAKAAASSMVRRSVTRGRSASLEFEHAPFWLRPGHTITAQFVTGAPERHLVSRVDFDLPSGRGHVRTRLPENVTITTGE